VGAAPCSGTKHDLNLLTTRETSHGIVRNELRLQAKVSKVLLNLPTDKGTKETQTLSLPSIDLKDFLETNGRINIELQMSKLKNENPPSQNHA
jgi:hypothetical protein